MYSIWIVVGGDACPPELVQRWAPGRRICSTATAPRNHGHGVHQRRVGSGGAVTIGGPVRGVSAVVLDGSGNPVPVGVTGELYIAGSDWPADTTISLR